MHCNVKFRNFRLNLEDVGSNLGGRLEFRYFFFFYNLLRFVETENGGRRREDHGGSVFNFLAKYRCHSKTKTL